MNPNEIIAKFIVCVIGFSIPLIYGWIKEGHQKKVRRNSRLGWLKDNLDGVDRPRPAL